MTEPTHNITTERATDLLKDGRPLTDFYVDGELKLKRLTLGTKKLYLKIVL
jgi:hypothetical protein